MPMLHPVQLAVFDLGSTLIYARDPWDGYFPRADQALWEALQSEGVAIEPETLFGKYRGLFDLYYELHRNDLSEPSVAGVLDELLRAKGITLPPDGIRRALRAMFSVTQANWYAEDDALPTLQAIGSLGIHTALISNASDDDNTQALIDKGGFRPYLKYIISSASFGMRKPHADIFRSVLEHFDVPAAQAVMIGDDYEADIVGAAGVGMQAIWITRRAYGPEKRQDRARASAVAERLADIPALLRSA